MGMFLGGGPRSTAWMEVSTLGITSEAASKEKDGKGSRWTGKLLQSHKRYKENMKILPRHSLQELVRKIVGITGRFHWARQLFGCIILCPNQLLGKEGSRAIPPFQSFIPRLWLRETGAIAARVQESLETGPSSADPFESGSNLHGQCLTNMQQYILYVKRLNFKVRHSENRRIAGLASKSSSRFHLTTHDTLVVYSCAALCGVALTHPIVWGLRRPGFDLVLLVLLLAVLHSHPSSILSRACPGAILCPNLRTMI